MSEHGSRDEPPRSRSLTSPSFGFFRLNLITADEDLPEVLAMRDVFLVLTAYDHELPEENLGPRPGREALDMKMSQTTSF